MAINQRIWPNHVMSPVGIHVMSLDWFKGKSKPETIEMFPFNTGPKPPVWSEVHCDNLMQDISGQEKLAVLVMLNQHEAAAFCWGMGQNLVLPYPIGSMYGIFTYIDP